MKTQFLSGNPVLLWFSLPMILLVGLASVTGLLAPDLYAGATQNWLAQTTGQDAVDLFLLVPVLLIGTLYSYRGNRFAGFMWVGAVLYTGYTFVIYAFAVAFNPLFLVYCCVLGLSVYSLIWFFSGDEGDSRPSGRWHRIAGYYLLIIGGLFYLLWLSDVVPSAFSHSTPTSIQEAGLLTNPVHVLDLALFLPAILITGWWAVRDRNLGRVLVPSMLMFLGLMEVTIAILTLVMDQAGVGGSVPLAIAMFSLTAFSIFLFVATIRTESR